MESRDALAGMFMPGGIALDQTNRLWVAASSVSACLRAVMSREIPKVPMTLPSLESESLSRSERQLELLIGLPRVHRREKVQVSS